MLISNNSTGGCNSRIARETLKIFIVDPLHGFMIKGDYLNKICLEMVQELSL